MRKTAVFLIIIMLFSMTGCTFYNSSRGIGKSDYADQTQQLLDALSQGDLDSAMKLMHPDAQNNARPGLTQIVDYLDGRKVVSMEQMRIHTQSNSSLTGSTTLEQAGFDLKLDDGTLCSVSMAYMKDSAGEGYTSVQLILGVY